MFTKLANFMAPFPLILFDRRISLAPSNSDELVTREIKWIFCKVPSPRPRLGVFIIRSKARSSFEDIKSLN